MKSYRQDVAEYGIANATSMNLNMPEDFPLEDLRHFIKSYAAGWVGGHLITLTCADLQTLQRQARKYGLVRVRMDDGASDLGEFSIVSSSISWVEVRRQTVIRSFHPKEDRSTLRCPNHSHESGVPQREGSHETPKPSQYLQPNFTRPQNSPVNIASTQNVLQYQVGPLHCPRDSLETQRVASR